MTVPLVPLYLAGPLLFSECGCDFKDSKLWPMLHHNNFDLLDPAKLTDRDLLQTARNAPEGARRREEWSAVNRVIAANNIAAIRRSRLLVAILDGSDVDSGTAAEIGVAFALGIPIIGYRSDFRLCGDNEGAIVNLQVQFCIEASGGEIVRSLQDLEPVLVRWYHTLTT